MNKRSVFAFALASLACTFASSADPTPKAVWDSNENTFTFYCDENTYEGDGVTQYALPTENKWNTYPDWNLSGATGGPKASVTKVVFDASFANCQPICMNYWFDGFSLLEEIDGFEYLDTSKAGYCSYMFSGCKSLTSLDLSHFNTSKMMFRGFFNGCSNIEVLNLTSFTAVSDVRSMFSGMTKLKTIYVTELFVWSGSTDNNTFKNCSALVGGAGTAFATAKVASQEYARIDNPPDAPGYFTLGQKPVAPEIESVTASDLTYNSITITVEGSSLNGGTIAVELVAGGETAETELLSDFGVIEFTELTPETGYVVKVTATSGYGTTVNTDCVFATPAVPAECWLYDASEGSVSWSEWKFDATLAQDGTIKIGAVTHWPDVAMALDFSRQVKDGDGTDYVISELSPAFGHHDKASSYKPAGYEPQCLRVGLLTLPGEGLVSIGQAAFSGCANATGVISFPSTLTSVAVSCFADCPSLAIDGSTLPAGVTLIPQYCFRGDKAMFGDVMLTNVTEVADSAFQETDIASVTFGPCLVKIGGNYERGAFQKCASLTNIVFDAAASVRIANGFTFQSCSKLEELNLLGVVDFAITSDRDDYSNVYGCSKLKKMTFGAGLTNLMCNAMAGATALEKVVFEGVPPVGFGMPYLSATNSKGEHATGYDSRMITTCVHGKLVYEPNAAGVCWADYAADRRIAPERKNPANNTTWSGDFIYEGVDPELRPLVSLEPDVGTTVVVK